MPRLLVNSSVLTETVASTLGATVGFVVVCAVLLLACASHSEPIRRMMSSMSFRRHEPVIISVQQEEQQPCIWQKGIMMGEKCQLPDFSGIITYDTKGNLVAPGRPRAVPELNW